MASDRTSVARETVHGGIVPTPPDFPVQGTPLPLDIPPFEQIFNAEVAYVGRTLAYLGVRAAEVEDACQEVFLTIHKRMASYHGGSLRAWVRQICIHTAQNYRRTKRRHSEIPTAEVDTPPVFPAQEHTVARRQLRERLLELLDMLTDEQRAVFVMYEIEQLSMVETAEAVGCPLQTAYSRLNAARAKLRAGMREHL
jgi:RNA polymerase sigma-70 factor (ECF subfamily)